MIQLCTDLNEDVSHSQTGSPGYTSLVDRLEVLQCWEGRSGSELLNGCLGCNDRITHTHTHTTTHTHTHTLSHSLSHTHTHTHTHTPKHTNSHPHSHLNPVCRLLL